MSRHPRPRPHRGHVQLTVSCLFLSGGVKEGRIRRGTVGDRHGSAGVSCRRRAFSFFLFLFSFIRNLDAVFVRNKNKDCIKMFNNNRRVGMEVRGEELR